MYYDLEIDGTNHEISEATADKLSEMGLIAFDINEGVIVFVEGKDWPIEAVKLILANEG